MEDSSSPDHNSARGQEGRPEQPSVIQSGKKYFHFHHSQLREASAKKRGS